MASVRKTTIIGLPAYELSAGGYRAVVCPALGGNCLRLTHAESGAELLRTPASIEDVQANPNVYGMPFLFPPNRISRGTYEFEGRRYTFPLNGDGGATHIHGLLSRTPFEVTEIEADGDATSIGMAFAATAEKPYLSFPHAFRVTLRLTLSAEGLRHRAEVVNDSAENMPLGAGFHTTLRAPFLLGAREEDCRFTLGAGREWLLPKTVIPDGRTRDDSPLQASLRGEGLIPCEHALSNLFEAAGPARVADTASGRAIEYELEEGFRFWMVWNRDGRRGFLCPEPQSWMNDAPNQSLPHEVTGFRALAPGEKASFGTRIRLV